MRTYHYFTLFIILFTVSLNAQRKEIRAADRLIEEGEFYLAKKEIDKIGDEINQKSNSLQARYHHTKGMIYLGLNAGELSNVDDIQEAIDEFKKVEELGKTAKAKEGMTAAREVLLSQVVNGEEKEDYKKAYDHVLLLHKLQPKDTLYMYFAANHAFHGEMDEEAISLFEKLKAMDFKGNKKIYTAVDKSNGKKREFATKEERDAVIKLGGFEKPDSYRSEGLHGEVLRKLAILYYDDHREEEAENLFKTARKERPNDFKIVQGEAGYYKDIGDSEKFEALYKELISRDSDHAVDYHLYLANDALDQKNHSKAQEHFKKAIEIDANHGPAYQGMAMSIILDEETALNKEIQNLDEEEKTEEKIEELQKERKAIYEKAIPYLEKSFEYDKKNLPLTEMLYKLHMQLKNKDEAEKYRKVAAKLSRKLNETGSVE